MKYKCRIVLEGIVEAPNKEEAKKIYADKTGDEMFSWFAPEDVEAEEVKIDPEDMTKMFENVDAQEMKKIADRVAGWGIEHES